MLESIFSLEDAKTKAETYMGRYSGGVSMIQVNKTKTEACEILNRRFPLDISRRILNHYHADKLEDISKNLNEYRRMIDSLLMEDEYLFAGLD